MQQCEIKEQVNFIRDVNSNGSRVEIESIDAGNVSVTEPMGKRASEDAQVQLSQTNFGPTQRARIGDVVYARLLSIHFVNIA